MPFIRKIFLLSLALLLVILFYFLNNAGYKASPGLHGMPHLSEPLFDTSTFTSGIPKAPGEEYTKALVIARLESEDVSWVATELPELNTAIYTVDGNMSNVPKNKGHEAMVYLTYIIEHYDNLPDIIYFFHPHRTAWHNNILLDIDSATTIRSLSSNHIIRQGYMNTRCHLDPGCPDWLHVDRSSWQYNLRTRPEEPYLTSQLFHELHGADTPIPVAMSQPCCAQFAVSGQRIHARPLDTYVHYRDWLLNTPLPDNASGRLMEYSWQYLFTGLFEFCPEPHICYCDGYGICFGGAEGLESWMKVLKRKEAVDARLVTLWHKKLTGDSSYAKLLEKSNGIMRELQALRAVAVEKGNDARLRAEECGRAWKDGDGY